MFSRLVLHAFVYVDNELSTDKLYKLVISDRFKYQPSQVRKVVFFFFKVYNNTV